MTSCSIVVFILLTNLWNDGYTVMSAPPKRPTLTSNINATVIEKNTNLIFQCYTESQLEAAAANKEIHYSFYKDFDNPVFSSIDTQLSGIFKVEPHSSRISHNYTCTAAWKSDTSGSIEESLHSLPRNVTIIDNLKEPYLLLPDTSIEGESFTMKCTSEDSRATSYHFVYGGVNYDNADESYTVVNTSLGKLNASCQYFIGNIGSPLSEQVEVAVRPKTPTLTANRSIAVVVPVDQLLTLTCQTETSYPNTRKTYKFYKEQIQISKGFVNTYNITTRSTAPLTNYTCTVTMETVESFHSLPYLVEIILNGGVSSWTPWQCHVTCGNGTESRTRECDNPVPQYGGKNCSQSLREYQNCSQAVCPELTTTKINGKSTVGISSHSSTISQDQSSTLMNQLNTTKIDPERPDNIYISVVIPSLFVFLFFGCLCCYFIQKRRKTSEKELIQVENESKNEVVETPGTTAIETTEISVTSVTSVTNDIGISETSKSSEMSSSSDLNISTEV